MPIDWFTVSAQILNFLLLVWLMKRYLYRPILQAIDAREKRIADELAEAAAMKVAVQAEQALLDQKNHTFVSECAELLNKAKMKIDEERQQVLAETRNTAGALLIQKQQALNVEVASLEKTIACQTQSAVVDLSRKALRDLAEVDLEQQIIAKFIAQLQSLDDDAKADIAASLQSSATIFVRSSNALSAQQQIAIQQTLANSFATHLPIQFEINATLLCGIELITSGQKIAWNVEYYLQGFALRTNQSLNAFLAKGTASAAAHSPDIAAPSSLTE